MNRIRWSRGCSRNKKISWKGTPLQNIKERSNVYFVHSFYPIPENPEVTIATTKYGNQEFCAVVKKNNVIGTQFHPEKSGLIGLNILQEFCKLYNI